VVRLAVVDYNLWIWHTILGMTGSHNNINMLQRSLVFATLVDSMIHLTTFEINGHHYTKWYYLDDVIYLRCSTSVKAISERLGLKKSHFALWNES
jgi:hypothetical protein